MSFAQLVHAAPAVEASTLVRLYLEGFDPVEHTDARLPFRLLTQPRLALGLMLYLEGFDSVEHTDARLPFRLLTQPRLALGLMLYLEGFDPVEHTDARLPFRLLTQPRLALGLMLYLEGFDSVEHTDARLPFRLLTQPRLALGLMLYLEGFDPVEHTDARLPFRLLTQPRLALGLMLYLEGFDPVEHTDARLPFRLLTQPRLALGLMLYLEGFDPVEHADAHLPFRLLTQPRLALGLLAKARLPGGLGRRLLLADTGLAHCFLGGKPVAVAHMVHAAAAIEARALVRLYLEGFDPVELALKHDRCEPVDQRADADLAGQRGHRAAPGKPDIGRRAGPAFWTRAAREGAARVKRQRLEIDGDRPLPDCRSAIGGERAHPHDAA